MSNEIAPGTAASRLKAKDTAILMGWIAGLLIIAAESILWIVTVVLLTGLMILPTWNLRHITHSPCVFYS